MSSTKSKSQRKISWWSVAAIVVLLVIGALFIVAYAVNEQIINYIIGIGLLVAGIGLIIFGLVRSGKLLSGETVGGIFALSAGIAVIVNADIAKVIATIVAWFTFIMGIVLFIVGIILLIKNAKKNLITGILGIAFGAVMGVLGGLMLFPTNDPILGAKFVWLICGIVLILVGIYLLLSIFFPGTFSTKVTKKTKVED